MSSWLCYPCKGGAGDSTEEVRVEAAAIVDGEAGLSNDDLPVVLPAGDSTCTVAGANSQGTAGSHNRTASDTSMVTTTREGLEVPVGGGNGPMIEHSGSASMRSAMASGQNTPSFFGGSDQSTPKAAAMEAASSLPAVHTTSSSKPATVPAFQSDEERELALIEKLKDATDDVRVWLRESLIRWRKLPVGDECDGEAFLEAASTVPTVYPWVFKIAYASNYLTKDFKDHIHTVREKRAKGATSLREYVKMELKAEGGEEKLGKKYWKTLSVRLLWITRTMRMFDVIMEVLATTNDSPVQCGRAAVDRILTPYLSWALKKVAEYIIGACCWKSQDLFFEKVNVAPAEFKECVNLLYPIMRRHADALEQMLQQEIPNVFKKKCA